MPLHDPFSLSWPAIIGALVMQSVDARAQPHWPQFRGPNGSGISIMADPPVAFGPGSNQVWKIATPAGHSSPCAWGKHVFLTGHDGKQMITLAVDRGNGRELWRQRIEVEHLEKHPASSNPVTATPATDGERVYAYFGSFGMVAYTPEGVEAWRKPMTVPKNHYGTASSPIVHGDAVILVVDTDGGDSQLLAMNRKSGETLWKQERSRFPAGWSTPVVWAHDGAEEIVVTGTGRLVAYDAKTGSQRWWVDGFPQETVNSPVVGGGMLFASSAALGGRGNEKFDPNTWREILKLDRNKDGKLQFDEIPDDYKFVLRPELPKDHPGYAFPAPFKAMFKDADTDKDGAISEAEWNVSSSTFETFTKPVLMAIRPGGKDDAKQSVAWEIRRGIPEIPSPLYYQGAIYMVRDGGLLTCIDAKNGTVRYQERLGVGGQYAASPIVAGGRIYVASQSGTVIVAKPGETSLEILAKNELGEMINATPAIAERTLIVQTAGNLYSFETK